MILNNIFYFLISFLITFFSVPTIRRIAFKKNIFDKPDLRKQKGKLMVRLGGGSFVLGYFVSIILLLINYEFTQDIGLDINLIQILFFGSLCFYILGFIDDLFNISPFTRLVFQVIISLFIWNLGFKITPPDIDFLNISLSNTFFFNILSFLITSFWIIGVINSINWLDGLDGLATGCSIIFSLAFILIGIKQNDLQLIGLTFPLIGGLLAFLKYNYYPARIFMGDGGSYFLGYHMSILSILAANSWNINFSLDKVNFSSFFLAIIILAVPLLDMTKVIFLRICNGKSPFYPDRNHFHHQILKLGFNERITVTFVYVIAFLCAKFAEFIS